MIGTLMINLFIIQLMFQTTEGRPRPKVTITARVFMLRHLLHPLPIKIAPSDLEAEAYMLSHFLQPPPIKIVPSDLGAEAYMLRHYLCPDPIKIAPLDLEAQASVYVAPLFTLSTYQNCPFRLKR